MPNIKSAKKRVKVNAVKALNNQMAKSELHDLLQQNDFEDRIVSLLQEEVKHAG